MMGNLSPIGWALRPLKNYANFSGRAARAEFWWFFLFMMILYVGMWLALLALVGGVGAAQSESPLAMVGAIGVAGIFMVLFWLAILIPTIAIQVRRLHDIDRSGWWIGAYYLVYLAYMVMALGAAASADDSSMGVAVVVLIIAVAFFIYSIALLVFYCLPGTPGANRYGPDPYGADVGQVFA